MTIDADLVIFALTVFGLATLTYVVADRFTRDPSELKPDARQGYAAARADQYAPAIVQAARRIKPRLIGSPRKASVPPHSNIEGSPAVPAAATPADQPHALSLSRQIDRLQKMVTAGADRAGDVERLHRGAGQQIDLASYAVQNLLDELAGIIPSLSATQSSSAETVSSHVIPGAYALAA